jgi:hypothetical protein
VATYWRGFADGIADWTQVVLTSGHSAPAWSVVNTDQLQATSASSHNEALVWGDIDADADRDDFEILCQIYVDSTSTTQRWLGGRISTSGASRTGYAVRVRSNSIDTYRFSGSTYTAITNGTFSVTSGTWCWVRFRVNGSTVQARAWADGDSEPGTWQCSDTDTTYTTLGHVGAIKGLNTNTQLWRKFGVGTNGDTAPASAGGGATDLTVAEVSHGHTADSLTLSVGVSLAIDDATHGHAADNLTLSTAGSTSLTVADATHAHTADAPALTVDSLLAVADALHAHSADNVVLGVTGAADLVIADATHAHSVDGLVLTAQSLLAIQDALHAHAADALTLNSAPTLLIAEALHAHTSDGLALTVDAWLVIADARHAHAADVVALTVAGGDLSASPGYTITGRLRAFEVRGRTRRFEVDQ